MNPHITVTTLGVDDLGLLLSPAELVLERFVLG